MKKKMIRIFIVVVVIFIAIPSNFSHAIEVAPLKQIPDVFVGFDSTIGKMHSIVVEKQTQLIYLYELGHEIKEIARFNCSTGKSQGAKQVEGDQKTPEGVYFFTSEYKEKELTPIYGAGAFPTDYPNVKDRISGKNGTAIWLHGVEKKLEPTNTNGCIAVDNQNLIYLKGYIRLNKTPLIIVKQLSYISTDSSVKTQKKILKLISEKNNALEKGTYHHYLQFYDKDYLPNILWWPKWHKLREEIKEQPFGLETERISIFKYNDTYVSTYDQIIKYSSKTIPSGTMKLFLENKEDGFKIVAEEYLTTPNMKEKTEVNNLLATNLARLVDPPEERDKIKRILSGWVKAWSTKDINNYSTYYSDNFQSQNGMGRKEWVKYKENLNQKYDYINISIDKLDIKNEKGKYVASFRQSYKSNLFQSNSLKKVTFVKELEKWKIFREITN